MARLTASFLALALGACTALGLVACGDGDADLLPGGTASEINANLDQVRELVDEGECTGAEAAAQEVSFQVDALGGVDGELKQALREGATRLNEVVASCEEAPVEEETEPAIEPAEELEEVEEEPDEAEKAKKEAEKEEKAEEKEAEQTLPPQAEGKAKGQETPEEEVAPVESGSGGGTPAGGLGPSEAAGE